MLQMLMRFLPADKRAMIELAMRMVAKLDTAAERRDVAEWGIQAFKDGRLSVSEWATLGGKLGILTGPRRNGNG
jgi:hypothetical protein